MRTSATDSVSAPAVVVGSEEEAGYRTISVLAIVSLVLGIASPLSLIAPLLFAIPICGAALAFLAMRRIAASDGALIGRAAAAIGLALSIASVTAAYSRTTLTQELLSRQARVEALEWCRLLQLGSIEGALQLTSSSIQHPPPPLPDAPADESPSPLETFRTDPVVKLLLGPGHGETVKYVQDTAFDPGTGGSARIQQQFTVSAAADAGQTSPTTIEIVMQRTGPYGHNPPQWQVSAYRIDDGTPAGPK